jgi:uncharacterized caspase-like protein
MAPYKHSERERRLALVVGVNETSSRLLAPFKYAESDASVMAEVLTECCGFELIVPPLLGKQATSEAVRKAVLSLGRKRGEDDFLLLYFAGHGQPLPLEAERHGFDKLVEKLD